MVRCVHLWVTQGRVGTFMHPCCATVACPNTPLMELKEQIRGTSGREEEKETRVDLQGKQEVTHFWWLIWKCECCCLFFKLSGWVPLITHAQCTGLWVGLIFGHPTSCAFSLPRQLQGSVPWQTCWTHCNWVSSSIFERVFWRNNHNSS